MDTLEMITTCPLINSVIGKTVTVLKTNVKDVKKHSLKNCTTSEEA